MKAFRKFALGVVVWNLLVIVWGAYVRASKSGDGCGDHWPTCNGEVIPIAPSTKTLIEFSHRATSGLALISVVVLLVWAFRAFPRGHVVRKGAAASMFFMLTEAGVGAGLVLFKLVAGNDTLARAMFMAVHLVNTFVLVGAMTLTTLWAFDVPGPKLRGRGTAVSLAAASIVSMLLLGVSGAIAALGDTLFPAVSLLDSIRSDFAPTAHLFIKLRTAHPGIAIAAMAVTLLMVQALKKHMSHPLSGKAAGLLTTLLFVQLGLGITNVVLLAPIWLQLVHLLMADLVWITLVVTLGASFAASEPEVARSADPSPAVAV
jgi:cytochrome c oxidase assembly protein subunit 15